MSDEGQTEPTATELTVPPGRRLSVDVPEEPADRAVVLDRDATAWQRRAGLWHAVTYGPSFLSATGKVRSTTWSHLLVDRGPLTPLAPEPEIAETASAMAALVDRGRRESERRADVAPSLSPTIVRRPVRDSPQA